MRYFCSMRHKRGPWLNCCACLGGPGRGLVSVDGAFDRFGLQMLMDALKGIEVCFRPWSDSDEKDTAYPLYFFLILAFTILSLSYHTRFFFWFVISPFYSKTYQRKIMQRIVKSIQKSSGRAVLKFLIRLWCSGNLIANIYYSIFTLYRFTSTDKLIHQNITDKQWIANEAWIHMALSQQNLLCRRLMFLDKSQSEFTQPWPFDDGTVLALSVMTLERRLVQV